MRRWLKTTRIFLGCLFHAKGYSWYAPWLRDQLIRENERRETMSDLIYKQSVVNVIDGWIQCCTENDENAGIKSVLSLLKERIEHIESLPSADAVEVVRCKDCKWYVQKQKNLPYNVTKRYCNRTCTLATKEDDYCSYGERREP